MIRSPHGRPSGKAGESGVEKGTWPIVREGNVMGRLRGPRRRSSLAVRTITLTVGSLALGLVLLAGVTLERMNGLASTETQEASGRADARLRDNARGLSA